MEEQGDTAVLPAPTLLQPPTPKIIRMRSPSRGRSQTPVRGRSQTPLMRYREKSETPSAWRSITPFITREEKEKTPFEIGPNILLQLASYKAIFDKACVMDISMEEEPPAKYIISEHSVIDRAAVMDISNVEIIYVEDDFDYDSADTESYRESESPSSIIDESIAGDTPAEGEEEAPKEKKKKKAKKTTKKKEKKEKEPSPPKLKLDMGPEKPKVSKAKMFQQQQEKEEKEKAAEKPPPKRKGGKLTGALAAMQAEEAKQKEAEEQKRLIEEKMKKMKAEQEAKKQAEAEPEEEPEEQEEEREESEMRESGDERGSEERGSEEGSEQGSDQESGSGSGSGSEGGSDNEEGTERGDAASSMGRRGSQSSEDDFTRPNYDEEWTKLEGDGQGVIRSTYERKKHKKLTERERDQEWQKRRESTRIPRIHTHLKDVASEEGHNVKLTCTASGPELMIKWLRDGNPIERSPKYKILVNEGILSLEIMRALPSDSAEYTCSLTNINGEASTSAIVTVYDVIRDDPVPPTFTSARDYYHLNEDILGIEIHCVGTPRPKITWLRDMVEVKPSFKYVLLEEAHGVFKLEVYKPAQKDSGKYVCRAVNSAGEAEIVHNVQFIGKPKHFHLHGLRHAHTEIGKDKEEAAKRAMEEAMKAKEEYELRRTGKLPPRIRHEDQPLVSQKDRLKFATQLRDRTSLVGNKIKFTCSVLGPNPNIRWFKDGNPLQYGPNCRNLTAEGMSIVELSDITMEQTGEYKCLAKNDFSECFTTSYLKVYDAAVEGDKEAPLFVLSIRDLYHSQENDLIIDCKVRGNPRPVITWSKDELPIEFDERTQQVEHLDGLCELIINKPTQKDNGMYACTATNKIGTQKVSHKVEFQPHTPISRRDSGLDPEKKDEKDGESAADGGKGGGKGKRAPKAKTDSVAAEYTSRRAAGPTIEEMMKAARNKLSFVTHLTNRVFPEGSKVKLSCVVQGPDPNPRWLKEQNPIVYGPRVKNLSREGVCILEINNASPDDTGEYTLLVRNPDSDISCSCQLQVYATTLTTDFAPTFTRNLKNTYHLNTNEIYLETHVRGQPRPTIEWFKDSVGIDRNDAKYKQIDHPDGTCELVVNYPKKNDSGKFVCKASNRAGGSEIAHNVLFEGKEAHIADNRHRVYHADRTARAKSEVAQEDGAPADGEGGEGKAEEGKGKGRGRGKGASSAAAPAAAAASAPEPAAKVKETREPRKGINFASKLSNRVVAEGSKVKLTCYLEGADPAVRWLKGDQPVVYGPKCRQSNNNGVCVLEFGAVSEADSGSYTCFARNLSGEVTTTANLEVFPNPNPGSADIAPTFTRNIKDVYHSNINEISLSCHSRGFPTPTITWVKDGVTIEPSEKYQQSYKEDGTCELTINFPTKQDNGKYVCQAENRAGKTENTHIVQVQLREIHSPRTPPAEPVASKSASGTATPAPPAAAPTDEDKAKKAAARKKAREEPVSSGRRYVEPPPDPKMKLHFIAFLTDRIIAAGGKTRLSCYVQGPDPQVRWFKDDNPIVMGPNVRANFRDGLCTLDLLNATADLSGGYKIVARNAASEITCSSTVTVYETVVQTVTPPIFTIPIKESYQCHSNQFILECKVHGHPKPLISWFHNGIKINENENDKYLISESNRNAEIKQLIILNPTYEMNGVYTCQAENNLKTTQISHTVDLRDILTEQAALAKKRNVVNGCADDHLTIQTELPNCIDIENGGTAKLTCRIIGSEPNILWLKNGNPLDEDGFKYFSSITNGLVTLEILNIIHSDSGTYTCVIRNKHKTVSTSSLVKVIEDPFDRKSSIKVNDLTNGTSIDIIRKDDKFHRNGKRKPIFSTELMDRLVTENTTIKLTCNVIGFDVKVHWLRNTIPLELSPRHRVEYNDDGLTTLEIFSVTQSDSAEYTCVATNFYGEVCTSAYLKVYSGYDICSPMKPQFTRAIRDTYNLNVDELVLECRVRGQPKPAITWSKESEFIETNDKYQQYDQADGYCKLVIANPTAADSGNYFCCAENTLFSDKISHNVTFTGKDQYIIEKTHGYFHRDINKPHFQNAIGDHMVTQGGTIALQAEVLHGPVEIQWLRNREVIVPTGKVLSFQDHGVHTLIVPNATHEVSGAYTCRAKNAFGNVESTGHIHIVGPSVKGGKCPLFQGRPENEMKILAGDPFSLSFRLIGEPKPKLIFMKGTRDITNNDRVLKEAHDDLTRFTVQRSTPADSGTYWVVARNEHGCDRLFVTILVKRRARSVTPSPTWSHPIDDIADISYLKNPPGPISSEPFITDCGQNHVSLTWGKVLQTDAAPVLSYRVDAWLVGIDGGARWMELGVTPINSFDAFNLKEGRYYHIRITPRNRYGWGQSVQTTSPIIIGSVQCIPEFIKILPGQLKALIESDITLECSLKGSANVDSIIWYKNGKKLRSDDRITVITTKTICKVIVQCITIEDSGRYSCEATNTHGRASTFAKLQVVTDRKIYEADQNLKKTIETGSYSTEIGEIPPQFTMRLREKRVQMTYPVRLSCQVIGWPMVDLIWYKDNVEIEDSDRIITWIDNQFHTIEISNTVLADSGVYTATAKNYLGSVSCHCNLIVDKGIRGYIAPEFLCNFNSINVVKENHEVRLSAQIEAYPTVGIIWYRNGIRLRPSRRIQTILEDDGFLELVISNVTRKDAGAYTCIASNAVGRVESSCHIVIDDDNDTEIVSFTDGRVTNVIYSKEPAFMKKPRSSHAYEGDTVIIYCEVIGDPKPDVMWLRDFLKPEYYKDAPHFRRVGDGPEYRLEIPRAKLEFTGTYSVIAKNIHGEAKAIISLQIYAKDLNEFSAMDRGGGTVKHSNVETLPIFTRHLKDIRCCDGDSVRFECHFDGQPEPAIIWEKDGRVLSQCTDFVTNVIDGRATLTIRRIYPEDEGEYTCVAANNIGRAFSSACIIVDGSEENENLVSRQLSKISGLLSAGSTPYSTPRVTPARSVSPMSYKLRQHQHHQSSHNRQNEFNKKTYKCSAPKFYAVPNNRLAEEGETVELHCVIAGHPFPWSTWDKDGIIVTSTNRISTKERDDQRILEIQEVTLEDAGLYRITIENDYGRIEATARLDIIKNKRSNGGHGIRTSASPYRGTSYSRRIMGNSTRIGGRLVLACDFRSNSLPAQKFYHNGLALQDSDRIQMSYQNPRYTLSIDNVTETDQGIYTCVIENEDGLACTTTVVKFNDEDSSTKCVEPPRILEYLPTTIEAIEGQILDVKCKIQSTAPYDVIWYRDDTLICDSDDFRYIDHGNGWLTLRIIDPFVIDSGQYLCIIRSSVGDCSTDCNIQINEMQYNGNRKHPQEPPSFLKHLVPIISECGASVTCCVKLTPATAKTKWLICGEEVTNDDPGILIETESNGITALHINGIEFRHSGEVQCIAYNPTDNNLESLQTSSYSYIAVVPVIVPTKLLLNDCENNNEIIESHIDETSAGCIIRGPADCTALIGGCVTLSALYDNRSNGATGVTARWLKAGRIITENANTFIQTKNGKTVLEINSITADYSGKYTVEILNEFGMCCDMASASVAVEGPPEPPGGRPSISKGPDRVAVAWCGPPFDGGCIITAFILEIQQDNNEWKDYTRVIDSLAYTVKNLKSGCKYRFRVRAENCHGLSDPSQPSDEVTLNFDPTAIDVPDNCSKHAINRIASNQSFDESINVKSGGEFKERFILQEELGKGRFGVVYKVIERDTDHVLAAKIVKCIKAKDKEKIQDEIEIMKSLKHPKLLQLAASFESQREIIMVMEYISGGELFERVVADDFTLTERDCILFVRQICEGVNYMCTKSIVHLDLKPENIMCHNRTSHQIKIIDFGLAQRIKESAPIRVMFGTPEFIPPEIINYEPIGFQTDMWSVGVICYVLLSGLSPFMGDTDVETFTNISCGEYDFDDDAFDAVSQDAKDFISNLLVRRKEKRLTAQQCLESKWLTDVSDSLSNVKICTDKLKTFVIRRKWQKTGNAIRALGRMATLSASRRNSAASSSPTSNSPRPSISGGFFDGTNTPPLTTTSLPTISALNEYDSKFSQNSTPSISSIEDEQHDISDMSIDRTTVKNIELNSILKSVKSDDTSTALKNHIVGIKLDKKPFLSSFNSRNNSTTKLISERTSIENNIVGGSTIRRQRSLDKFPRKLERIVEIKCEKPIIRKLSVDDKNLTKLSTALKDTSMLPSSSLSASTSSSSSIRSLSLSPSPADNNLEPVKNSTKLSRSFSIDAKTIERRKPIMKSDFTNTVLMRKHSLEMNAQKEKVLVRPKVNVNTTSTGIVSMMKQKFSSESLDNINSGSQFADTNNGSNKFCMNPSKSVAIDKKFCSNNNDATNTNILSRYSTSNGNNKTKINLVRSKSNADTSSAKATATISATKTDTNKSNDYKSIRLNDRIIKRSDRTNFK